MQIKKRAAVLLAILLCISNFCGSVGYCADTPVAYSGESDAVTTSQAVDAAMEKVYANGIVSDWYVADMAADGVLTEEMYSYTLTSADSNKAGLVTDMERQLIMESAVGIRDEELAATICSYADAMAVNQTIFALIAIDSGGYETEVRQQLKEALIASQNAEGGFGSSVIDADLTAMAVWALSPYKTEYEAQISKALNALATTQVDGGAFVNRYGIVNSNTTAMAIIALCAVGEYDNGFNKNGTPLDGLLSFMNDAYTFGYKSTSHNALATEQAFRALVALKKQLSGDNTGLFVFNNFASGDTTTEQTTGAEASTELSTETATEASTELSTEFSTETTTKVSTSGGGGSSTKKITVGIGVNTSSENRYNFDFYTSVTVVQGSSVWVAVKKALDENGLVYQTSGGDDSIYLAGLGESRDSLLSEFDMGVNSGWMYSVNGVMPDVSMSGYKLSDGDSVSLFYTCDYTKSSDSSYNSADIEDNTGDNVHSFSAREWFCELIGDKLPKLLLY